jgi:hypothetical protein
MVGVRTADTTDVPAIQRVARESCQAAYQKVLPSDVVETVPEQVAHRRLVHPVELVEFRDVVDQRPYDDGIQREGCAAALCERLRDVGRTDGHVPDVRNEILVLDVLELRKRLANVRHIPGFVDLPEEVYSS